MSNLRLKKRDTIINRFGLEFEVEVVYSEAHKVWVINDYNAAKMLVYKDSTTLYHPEVEKRLITEVMAELTKGGQHE